MSDESKEPPATEQLLDRIADALERIAFALEEVSETLDDVRGEGDGGRFFIRTGDVLRD